MFTGIIEATARIISWKVPHLIVERPKMFADLHPGSSVAVCGVCLTVEEVQDDALTFSIMPQTRAVTRLKTLKTLEAVNLERAIRPSDRFDGHLVQGHAEGMGEVLSLTKKKDDVRLTVRLHPDQLRFVILRGSIAIDGVSLTVAEIREREVTVALIPETLKRTTLSHLKRGDLVNIETDLIIRAIATLLPDRFRNG